eukprot:8450641-Ditylum_brightwellii.AAC.1
MEPTVSPTIIYWLTIVKSVETTSMCAIFSCWLQFCMGVMISWGENPKGIQNLGCQIQPRARNQQII